MDFIFSIFLSLFLLSLTLLLSLIFYFKRKYIYWEKLKVAFVPPTFPFGSIGSIFSRRESLSIFLSRTYKKFKESGKRHGGIYVIADPIYIPVDPYIIKNILIKDFNSFMNRSGYQNRKDDPLGINLLSMTNDEWKRMRTKLTPTFTSGKMKKMFKIFTECSDRLVVKINEHVEGKRPVEIKDFLGCFTTDIIGRCAFGIECNSFTNPNSDFLMHGKKVFSLTPFRIIKNMFARNFPNLALALRICITPKDVSRFFLKIVEENVRYREENEVKCSDFFQMLMDLEKGSGQSEKERIEKIAAQSYLFFNAGFESSSTAMTFTLYELASNRQIQQKLRNEINSTLKKFEGKVTFEAVVDMEYLDKVIQESMRKHPPFGMLVRKCSQDYQVPNSNVVIRNGFRVFISVLGIHHDPEYYPRPDVFDPERFSEKNKSQRPSCTYLPFGDGPRNCIGLRFGLLQIKLGLVAIIKNFNFTINPKTGVPTIENSIIHRFKGDILMDFEPVNNDDL